MNIANNFTLICKNKTIFRTIKKIRLQSSKNQKYESNHKKMTSAILRNCIKEEIHYLFMDFCDRSKRKLSNKVRIIRYLK